MENACVSSVAIFGQSVTAGHCNTLEDLVAAERPDIMFIILVI
jgi:hypothetical protein